MELAAKEIRMNKVGFMSQLEGLLAGVPAAERDEALQYYNDYFEDAGAENEQAVIKALGSPREIADNIKAELRGEAIPESVSAQENALTKYGQIVSVEGGEGKEESHQDGRAYEKKEAWQDDPAYESRRERYVNYAGADGMPGERGRGLPFWAWIVIGFFAVTVLLPGAFGTFFGLAAGFVAAWFGLIVAFGGTFLGLAISSVAAIVVSFLCLTQSVVAFCIVFGMGLLLGCVSILCLMATVWMCGVATPAMFKGIKCVGGKLVGFFKDLFKRIGGN